MNLTAYKIIGYVVFILGIFINPINAEIKGEVISVHDALMSAHNKNPDVLAARKRIEIMRARYIQEKAMPNPELEFEASKILDDLEGDSKIDSQTIEGEVRFTQEIDVWGKRKLKRAIAKDEITQAEAKYQTTWLDVVRKIKQQYAETLLNRKKIDIARENLNIARIFFDHVHIKYNTGKARNHELVRARLEKTKARSKVLEAEKEYRIAQGRLNTLMGKNMHTTLKLKDPLTHLPMHRTFDELFESALMQRADIGRQKKEILKNEREIILAKKNKLPDFNLRIFAEREEEIYSSGAAISFEFPLWNRYEGDVEEAELKKGESEINLNALQREVELDVYTAFQEVVLAQQQVAILEEAIHEVNELLRIITMKYEEGELSFLSYLENLNTYRETKQEYFEVQAHYTHKKAILDQVVGEKIKMPGGR